MVAALGYEAYRRSFGSTSRDQKGKLQQMVQVGHAHALFAAKAGSVQFGLRNGRCVASYKNPGSFHTCQYSIFG